MKSFEIQQRTERLYVINMMRKKFGEPSIDLVDILRVSWGEVERITEETRQIYNEKVRE